MEVTQLPIPVVAVVAPEVSLSVAPVRLELLFFDT
jgi:hypothetical protein